MRRRASVLGRIAVRPWSLAVAAVLVTCSGAGAAIVGQRGDSSAASVRPQALVAKGLKAPALTSPAQDADGESIPAFGWSSVRGAAKYEFQLSADRRFNSTLKSMQTLNTFATVDKILTDGTYYWRVRSIGAKDQAGVWSTVRSFTKSW